MPTTRGMGPCVWTATRVGAADVYVVVDGDVYVVVDGDVYVCC